MISLGFFYVMQVKIGFLLIGDTVTYACGSDIVKDPGLPSNDSLNERFQRNRSVEKCLEDTEQ